MAIDSKADLEKSLELLQAKLQRKKQQKKDLNDRLEEAKQKIVEQEQRIEALIKNEQSFVVGGSQIDDHGRNGHHKVDDRLRLPGVAHDKGRFGEDYKTHSGLDDQIMRGS